MLLDVSNEHMIERLTFLNDIIQSYNSKFEEIFSSNQIEIDNNKIQSEVNLARESHAIINEIKVITNLEFNKAYAITNNVNIFSILIGLFLSVIIAGFISTKIMEILGNSSE